MRRGAAAGSREAPAAGDAHAPRPSDVGEGATGTARLETFADGVFAIAITLLIIEVKVPRIEHGGGARELLDALARQWPSYAGYLISFLVIGIMWANHHQIFQLVRKSNHNFLVLNLLFLMCIAFIPFPTALLAEYLLEPGARVTAAVVYGAAFTVTAVFYNALWRYAAGGRRLIGEHVDQREVDAVTRRFRFGPVIYLLATLLALVSVPTSLGVHAGLALLYLLPYRGR